MRTTADDRDKSLRTAWVTVCDEVRRAMLRDMDGVSGILIKLGARLVVFGLVFWIATRKNPKVVIHKKWAMPLIAFVFAALNTGAYWLLASVLNIATLGAVGFLMPVLVNLLLLLGTIRIFESRKWFEVKGMMTTLWMATFLTLAHGALWLGFDYIPKHI